MISDKTISDRIASEKLIENADNTKISNCTYTLRVGSIFQPNSGAKEEKPPELSPGSQLQHWIIGPTECLIVQTKEVLNIPQDICAYYAPLNRLAQKGIMLLNASVIEPGYSGPLSCFLVNFSSQAVEIAPEQEIAKITFHLIDTLPVAPRSLRIDRSKYDSDLSSSARRFEKSFLGIDSIEERATKAAKESVGSSIKWGGILVAVLILFAQLEPLFSKWMWEKSGVITTTQRVDTLRMEKELESAEAKLKSINEALNDKAEIKKLEERIQTLQARLAIIESKKAKSR